MYNLNLSRFEKLRRLNTAAASFNKLKYKEPVNVDSMEPDKILSFTYLTQVLRTLRKLALPKRESVIRNELKKLGNKIKLPLFSLMEYDFHENSHSNILEYIFDYRLIGTEGSNLLAEFISNLGEDCREFSSLIKKRNYIIEREYPVKNGRMDLFIQDEKNKFAIVIENKIFAGIAEKEILPGEDQFVKTQLNLYLDHLNSNYSGYKKVFVLLSHRAIDNPENFRPFITTDYNYLFNILESFQGEIKDTIFDDYKILLHSLINDLYQNKINLFRQLNSIRTTKKIDSINLNSLEQLRILLNAFK